LAAAAVDRDCFRAQYKSASDNVDRGATLSSRNDNVLKFAYAAGDFLSDIFYDDDNPFKMALGLQGPRPKPESVGPAQIPNDAGYGHSDYMPPFKAGPITLPPAPAKAKWEEACAFLVRAFRGQAQTWP